ncbi:hypothetical protein ACROYT_G017865 [Oculina patagonica]
MDGPHGISRGLKTQRRLRHRAQSLVEGATDPWEEVEEYETVIPEVEEDEFIDEETAEVAEGVIEFTYTIRELGAEMILGAWATCDLINDVLNRHKNKPDTPVATVPKKDVIILLPYLGLPSIQITKRLKSCVSNFYSFVNLKIIFQNTRRIKSFFPYKDRLNRSQRSKVIYKASCWDCDDVYIGKTKRRLHDRKTEHFKALTKCDHQSAIADHIKTTGHNIKWDHFEILASGKTDLHCKIKETLYINELQPSLNANIDSERLLLY